MSKSICFFTGETIRAKVIRQENPVVLENTGNAVMIRSNPDGTADLVVILKMDIETNRARILDRLEKDNSTELNFGEINMELDSNIIDDNPTYFLTSSGADKFLNLRIKVNATKRDHPGPSLIDLIPAAETDTI
jgi:hypothetical protein